MIAEAGAAWGEFTPGVRSVNDRTFRSTTAFSQSAKLRRSGIIDEKEETRGEEMVKKRWDWGWRGGRTGF